MSADQLNVARVLLLKHFRWDHGHADVWAVFRDAQALSAVITGLVAPFGDLGVTAVAGIEARGFLLGGACATELGAGFVAIRKSGALFPGAKLRATIEPDYRARSHELVMQRNSVTSADRILLVDDWVETGSQARAVQHMVAEAGATLVGVAVMVDQLAPGNQRSLPPVSALVRYDELPADGAGGSRSAERDG